MNHGEYGLSELRWRVSLAKRNQAPAQSGNGVDETFSVVAQAWAAVEPVGGLTFWNSTQTDSPVTHHVVLRWVDYIDNTFAVLRTTTTPGGKFRNEVFRVRRVGEWGGRKRFTILDVELEAVA